MKRFVNFRPLVLMFLTFVGAVFSVIKAFLGNYVPLGIFLSFFAVVLTIFIISLFKKDFLKLFFERFGIKNIKTFCLLFLIVAIFASSLTATNFAVYNKRELKNDTYTVTATVKEVVKYEDTTKLLLGNVEIENKTYGFNIQATVEDYSFSVGDRMTFESYFSASKLVQNGTLNTAILKSNVQYYCSINMHTLTKVDGKAGFVDVIKDKTKTILLENMSEENAGFAYAVVCGDKSILSSEYSQIFRNGGLAHILAVSGLHVGFLVALLLFILKMCKLKSKYQFFVVLGVLFVYNLLCNFSPSVFRASVMSLCLLLGLILGKRNDSLSNIGLSGVIVLSFQPMYLFDVGFLLSFGSVFGIMLFANPLAKMFEKIKFPTFLSTSLSVTIAATIGTLPWICKYFNIFAPISFLSNLIVLPLFSVMFVILLLCVAINMIFSLPILLVFAQFFVNIVVSFSNLFAKFGTIDTISFSTLAAIIYYFVAFLASPYFMIKFRSKAIMSLCCLICLSCVLATCNTNPIINTNQIYATNSASKTLFLTTKTGKTILSNVDANEYHTKEITNMLTQKRIFNIDYLLLFNYNDNQQNTVADFAKKYNIKNIYVFGEYQSSTKLGLVNALYSSKIVEFVDCTNLNIDDIKIESIYANYTKAVAYEIDNKNILQILYAVSKTEINNNTILQKDFEIIVTDYFYDVFFDISSSNYVCRRAYNKTGKVDVIASGELWTLSL